MLRYYIISYSILKVIPLRVTAIIYDDEGDWVYLPPNPVNQMGESCSIERVSVFKVILLSHNSKWFDLIINHSELLASFTVTRVEKRVTILI